MPRKPTKLALVTPTDRTCPVPTPPDLTGPWRDQFLDLIELVSDQTGVAAPDATLAAEAVRAARRAALFDGLAAQALQAGDLKAARDAATSAEKAATSYRMHLNALKASPDRRSGKIGKAIAGQRATENTAWDDLL